VLARGDVDDERAKTHGTRGAGRRIPKIEAMVTTHKNTIIDVSEDGVEHPSWVLQYMSCMLSALWRVPTAK